MQTRESGKEEEDGDDDESSQRFGERRDTEPVRAARKVLSDVYVDMEWMLPSNKLKMRASPLLQKSSHEGASVTQHKADCPSRVHEHDRSREVVGVLGLDVWACGGCSSTW
jgi:hypothetical protein